MKAITPIFVAASVTLASAIGTGVAAAERWQEATFPPPNGGRLVVAITADGNPGCASYDGANCLWGSGIGDIDFTRVKPLFCGARHRRLYGVTGFEDPKHWCSLTLAASGMPVPRTRPAPPATQPPAAPPATPSPPATQAPPAPPAPQATPHPAPPAPSGPRLTEWSPWARAAGVDYRYRVRWEPATGGPGKTVEAIYDVRNRGTQRVTAVARSLDCAKGTLWGSTDVTLNPGEAREVRVRAPNCGSASNPDIRPNVVRAGKFD